MKNVSKVKTYLHYPVRLLYNAHYKNALHVTHVLDLA